MGQPYTTAIGYFMGVALSLFSPMPHPALAQSTWQNPPEPIATFLDAPALPRTQISPDHQWMVSLEHSPLKSITELARPRVQVAGIQLDPATRGPALEYPYRGLTLRHLATGKEQTVALPDQARVRNLMWSSSGRYLAFTLTQPEGLELWVADVALAEAKQLTPPILNAIYGNPCDWISEEAGLLCKVVPPNQGPPPAAPTVPTGPRIEQNLGREAPARTYTNLLTNEHDEALFEYYLTSVLEQVSLQGTRTTLTEPLLIDEATPSPNGEWILMETVERPFSYQVPVGLFPRRKAVLDLTGRVVFEAANLPLADNVPVNFDSVRTGRRVVWWRADLPATLFWVEAIDGGDARTPAPFRDQVQQLAAPFTEVPQTLWQTERRFNRITWGDATRALGYEYWHDTRRLRTWLLNPASPETAPVLLDERDAQDDYRDPGRTITAANGYGWHTLLFGPDGNSLYLEGRGASPEGIYPFLDRWDLVTNVKVRLWQSQDPFLERVHYLIDNQAQQFIIQRQTPAEPPNYRLYDRETAQSTPLTEFADPLPWFAEVTKEVVRYQRADGLDLFATLYLPPGYDAAADGPLPTLLWVYPQEYKSRESAAQVTASENSFSRPWGYSPLFMLTQGYAVMMGPTMPIIGEGNAQPNDTYLEQLEMSAQAAVDYLVQRGVSDRNQIAIGGESYGAFTTANLLAHTDLFSAGIALSGAYNRTLTPFGFQGEQRTYWEAQETYINMSPFTHAAQIKQPLLLIHGAEDDNSGTYPVQSERLYGALRGLGGTVRWVELPLEGHGYRSREAVGHVLWEVTQWLDLYVKGNRE
ncbi:prolyl oligopeptidase family serine peptidase [Pseudanabaena sp. FACHB-2040]|uniref:alpha/beta hydrolase family protein n=1 Tax=Pseudanabaena sp. FACHB-2040 TaxID=2692859 RepID=UPI001F556B5E|nr:prolyl oligopeptidase family serine peptidase [Pseudanabaena sp. FACHB-2040]